MNIWIAISLILAVVTIYLLVIEIFSVSFKLTGLATSKIKFQVASLFTSTGFTTAESELLTSDDRRRKIAVACMYTGHVFSVAFMGLIINVFFSLGNLLTLDKKLPPYNAWYVIALYVTSGLFLIMLILKIPPINIRFQRFLEAIAIRSRRNGRYSNIYTVLDVYGKHAIAEVVLNKIPDSVKDTPLSQMALTKYYSINILSIKRGKRIIDVSRDTMFRKRDILVIYGLLNDIREVFINFENNKKLKNEVDRSNEISLINNYGPNALVEIYVDTVPEELVDTKIKDAPLKEKYNITVAIIKRKDEYLYVDKDTIIQKGDLITLYGPFKNIKFLFNSESK